jgi:hypothetical protein
MKPGSKLYVAFMQKVQNFGLALFFFGIAAYFTQVTAVANVLLIAGAGLFGIAKFMQMISPQIEEDYEWEKVYPELNEEE